MKRALILVMLCFGMDTVALAQQRASARHIGAPPPPDTAQSVAVNTALSVARDATTAGADATPSDNTRTASSGTPEATPSSTADTTVADNTPLPGGDIQGAREVPLDGETFEARIHRSVSEYGQRHEQREREIMSYGKVSGDDPEFGRYADPRKVQIELNDELDREQISQELSGDYAEQAHEVQTKAKALQDFIAKRRETLEDLNKRTGGSHRQDLEVALANLARQPLSPETLAAMREIDRRLAETDRAEKDLPSRLGQNQQEAADAAEELNKLQALQQAYEKEVKAFSADAFAAHQNRQRLAGRLEYYVVRSQAEDELEQGRKAIAAAEHLPASPEIETLLTGSSQRTKSDADLQQLRDCIRDSGDVKGCRALTHQE